MSKLKLTGRDFTCTIGGEEKKFRVTRPNFIIGNKGDLLYKKAMNDAISMGLLTAFQMKDKLDTINYYKKSSDELTRLNEELEEKVEELKKFEGSKKDGVDLALKIREIRALRMLETYKANNIYENTAESYAENIRNQFYAASLTVDDGGNKVWGDHNAFLEETADDLAKAAIQNVILLNASMGNNYHMEYEENKWMISEGIIDEEGTVIDKDFINSDDEEDGDEPVEKEVSADSEKKADEVEAETKTEDVSPILKE